MKNLANMSLEAHSRWCGQWEGPGSSPPLPAFSSPAAESSENGRLLHR